MLINSSSGLHRAALAGMGVVMLPDALVAQDLEQGHLVALLQDYQLPHRPMSLMYAQDRYRLPKLRSFVEFAMQQWGKPQPKPKPKPKPKSNDDVARGFIPDRKSTRLNSSH